MSRDGQSGAAHPGQAATVVIFTMEAGKSFESHVHPDHQLAWASHGVLSVVTDSAAWVLPPTRALFIPAGVRHVTSASGPATMRTVYVVPERCPIGWRSPVPVRAGALLAELIAHLERGPVDPAARERAESFLFDLMVPAETATIEVRMPDDERALDVARALIDDPGDRRDLEAWGRAVGASRRTLTRGFEASGLSFGRWRTLVRLQAALPLLAAGEPVTRVATKVGYETPSAFVAAFRREMGTTPAKYFKAETADSAVT